MEKQNKSVEPYAPYFLLGLVCAVISISMWPLFNSGFISFYPRDSHAHIMIFGFFWSFIFGFLQTAIPRMTQTEPATKLEVRFGIASILVQIFINIFNFPVLSRLINLGQIVLLGAFLYRRWRTKKQVPFEGFVFLPFAFLSAAIGNIVLLVSSDQILLGYSLLSEGLLLNLIIGIGSKLFPVLMRLPNTISPDKEQSFFSQNKLYLFILQAVFFNSSFLFLAFGYIQTAIAIKFMFLISAALFNLKIFRKSTGRTYLGYGLRSSVGALLVGYLIWFIENSSSTFASQHIIFISGIFSITLLVATRVTLAHSGAGVERETTSSSILVVVGLLFGATFLRYMAGANSTSNLISGAFILGVLAILLWMNSVGHLLRQPSLIKQFFSKRS